MRGDLRKICNKCFKNLLLDKFRTRSENKKLRNECQDCQKAYEARYRAEKNERKALKAKKIENERKTGKRICIKCLSEKEINEINFRKHSKNGDYRNICFECTSLSVKTRIIRKISLLSEDDKRKLSEAKSIAGKSYRENNKEKEKNRHKKYNSSENGIAKRRSRENNKLKNDICFRLRKYLPAHIRSRLRRYGQNKNYNSILTELNYTIKDLYEHIAAQFEPWMNWDNWGLYNPNTWNDEDISTWTWNIDHIIPQSDLPYLSMSDDNFKKCWALDNLRPLSAKQNVIDGASRNRHANKNRK